MQKKHQQDARAKGRIKLSCAKCRLRANDAFREFERDELDFIETFKVGELAIDAGATILMDGQDSPHLYTVLSGWAVRFKLFEGGQRQVLNFSMPGDLIGLQSAMFDKMHHTVESLTDMQLCVFNRDRVWELYRLHPGLGFDMTWLAAREESIMAEYLANVGQRPALERIAYLILHLLERGRRAGLAKGNTLMTPITQEHVADAIGLSIVHTNKTLQRLRATGLMTWKRGEITIHDAERMAGIAGFQASGAGRRPFI